LSCGSQGYSQYPKVHIRSPNIIEAWEKFIPVPFTEGSNIPDIAITAVLSYGSENLNDFNINSIRQ
jgi:hypothetical protein